MGVTIELARCYEETDRPLKIVKSIFSERHQAYVSQAVQTYKDMGFEEDNINEMEEDEPFLTLDFLTIALPYYLDHTNFGETNFSSKDFVNQYGQNINLDFGFYDKSDQIVNMALEAELLHDFFWDFQDFLTPDKDDSDTKVL